jgi:Protein of unknown function (DUF3823) N-terminal domain/Domain of unknown function (DUF3823_C)
MKRKIIFSCMVALVFFISCKKDNKEAPQSTITGRIVYNSQPIQVKTNAVQLELWQNGYQLFTKIPVYISQDGTFSAKVFDGTYKLTRLKGNGPWQDQTDTIIVNVKGSAAVDVPVTPYFTVSNESFTFNASDTTLRATVKINQVVTSKAVEKIALYIGQTQFVDNTNQLPYPTSANEINPPANYLTQPVSFTVSMNPARYPATAQAELRRLLGLVFNNKYAFARIGVKTVGVTERVYTTATKVNLQ